MRLRFLKKSLLKLLDRTVGRHCHWLIIA